MSEMIWTVLGVAFAGSCVWLTVQILNGNKRWAKWTLAAVIGLALYVASLGPACWISSHSGHGSEIVSLIYDPLMFESTSFARSALHGYSQLGAAKGWHWSNMSGGWTNLRDKRSIRQQRGTSASGWITTKRRG